MITTFKPKSKILEPYVDFFYLFSQNQPINVSYIAFPHTNTGVSFFKNVAIKRIQNEISITSENPIENNIHIEILGKYLTPVLVHYSGNIEEIAIIFKPLGINHFLKNPLYKIAPLYSQGFNHEKWLHFGDVLFEENSIASQLSVLENFLISQLQEMDLTLMYKAVKYLEQIEEEYPIETIANFLSMNLKTFQRHFYKHLVCTPSDFRRIVKFRHSLNIGLMEDDIKKLTAIAYDSNYYDQSYFVREYKKLTTFNPKTFFNSITTFDDHNIVWKIK